MLGFGEFRLQWTLRLFLLDQGRVFDSLRKGSGVARLAEKFADVVLWLGDVMTGTAARGSSLSDRQTLSSVTD